MNQVLRFFSCVRSSEKTQSWGRDYLQCGRGRHPYQKLGLQLRDLLLTCEFAYGMAHCYVTLLGEFSDNFSDSGLQENALVQRPKGAWNRQRTKVQWRGVKFLSAAMTKVHELKYMTCEYTVNWHDGITCACFFLGCILLPSAACRLHFVPLGASVAPRLGDSQVLVEVQINSGSSPFFGQTSGHVEADLRWSLIIYHDY